jgi:hypothetical protein
MNGGESRMIGAARTEERTEPRKKPRRGPTLREATFKDYEQIVLLESRFGLTAARSYEEWSQLWLGNPLYRELQASWSIGWVLEDENSRIVGSLGNIPRSYEFQGRRILTASSHGWVADTEYRSAALLLLDRLINQPHVDLFLTNTNSVASSPAVSAFQCTRVPVGQWDESAFWITDYQNFVERLLVRKNYSLAKSLSYPLSVAGFLKNRFTKKTLYSDDVEVEGCLAFDDRFDEFWEDLRKCSPHLLLAVRTREVLEWHYKYGLLNNRVWIVTIIERRRIVAYAIFDKKEYSKGYRQVRLVDFQSLDGGTALLSPLLSWALKKCRAEGIHALVIIGRWLEKGELLERIAPYRRRLPNWVYFYRANSPELAESLKDRRAWAPSLFDGDAGLLR